MLRTMQFTNVQKQPSMSSLPIVQNVITEVSKESFQEILNSNTGAFIIKFGAEWCGPCKKIDPLVYQWMAKLSVNPKIKCAIIDVDDSFEVYAFLKNKKQLNGVPAILCYAKGNLTWIPNHSVIGADENQVNTFFQTCMQYCL